MSNDEILNNAFREGYRFGVWQQMEQTRKETKESANAFAFQSPTDCSSMRADFAKVAMKALIQREPKTYHYQRVAQIAVNFADALIKELNQSKQ